MPDERQIKDAERMGQMIANVHNLKESVDKLELTVNTFGDRLDKLALDMNSLLGTQNSILALQRQANDSTNWISENKEFIAGLKDDKKDTRGRLKDFLFSYILPHLITAVILYLVLIWKQQDAIDQITNSLK